MSGKKRDPTDDTNYFSSLKYGRDEGVGQDVHVDLSDAYANFHHYTISFEHIATQKTVHFKAFVKEYSEGFNCSWTPTTVYGRTDPIQNYAGTSRRVQLTFDVPAASVGEAYENMGRVSKLVQMLYPTYTQSTMGEGLIIGQSPLVRVKMMNLITSERATVSSNSNSPREVKKQQQQLAGDVSPAEALLNYKTAPSPSLGVIAAIESINYRSDLTKIQIFEKEANTILPQSLTVTLGFTVVHEETLGWDASTGESLSKSFPHKIILSNAPDLPTVVSDQNPSDVLARIEFESTNQAREDQKRAAKNRFIDNLALRGMGKLFTSITSFGGSGYYSAGDIPTFGDDE
tara:strand:- start:4193 stop:5227 length:1035 start_codon:yes stop_codon:yes gene_type:complete